MLLAQREGTLLRTISKGVPEKKRLYRVVPKKEFDARPKPRSKSKQRSKSAGANLAEYPDADSVTADWKGKGKGGTGKSKGKGKIGGGGKGGQKGPDGRYLLFPTAWWHFLKNGKHDDCPMYKEFGLCSRPHITQATWNEQFKRLNPGADLPVE